MYEASNQFHSSDLMLAVDLAAFRIMEQYILGTTGWKSDASVCPEVEKVIEDLKRPDRLCPDSLDRAIARHLQDVPKISALKKPLKSLAEPEVCYRKNVGYNYALPVNVT